MGCLTVTALLMFFTAILTDSSYYHKRYPHPKWDYVVSALSVILGAAIMFLMPDRGDGFLYGTFVAVLGNFIMLNIKYARYHKDENVAAGPAT